GCTAGPTGFALSAWRRSVGLSVTASSTSTRTLTRTPRGWRSCASWGRLRFPWWCGTTRPRMVLTDTGLGTASRCWKSWRSWLRRPTRTDTLGRISRTNQGGHHGRVAGHAPGHRQAHRHTAHRIPWRDGRQGGPPPRRGVVQPHLRYRGLRALLGTRPVFE